MKKTLKHPISKPSYTRWVLLSLTVICWLVVCGWVFYTAQSQDSDSRLTQNDIQMPPIKEDVPELKLIDEELVKDEELVEPVDTESEVTGNLGQVVVVSKPLVINVDVSSFSALDRAEEIVLNSDADWNYRAPKLVPSNEAEPTNQESEFSEQGSAPSTEVAVSQTQKSESPAEKVESSEQVAVPPTQSGPSTEEESDNSNQAADNERASAESERVVRNRFAVQQLAVLVTLSGQIRFNPNDARINQELEGVLDRMFDLLYLYYETRASVSVATNESRGAVTNNLLSRGRGQAIVAYWVSRGIEVDRISIFIESGDELPFGEHRVRVFPEGMSR